MGNQRLIPPPPKFRGRDNGVARSVSIDEIAAIIRMVDTITVGKITELMCKHREGSAASIRNRVVRAVLILAARGKIELFPVSENESRVDSIRVSRIE